MLIIIHSDRTIRTLTNNGICGFTLNGSKCCDECKKINNISSCIDYSSAKGSDYYEFMEFVEAQEQGTLLSYCLINSKSEDRNTRNLANHILSGHELKVVYDIV